MRAVRVVLTLVVFVFVAFAARKLALRWESGKVHVALLPAVLSLAPLIAAAVLLAWGWKQLVAHLVGRQVPTGPAVALNLESQLARYMPGKVGVPVLRMAGADALGVPAITVGSSVFIEILSSEPVGAAVAGALLVSIGGRVVQSLASFEQWGFAAIGVLATATAVLVLVDRRHYPALALRLLKLQGRGPLCPPILPLVHVGYWALWAVHGALVSYAVGADLPTAIASSGLYALAPVVGFMAVPTPAGIGVREAVVSMGLVTQLGSGPALAAAILSRGISLAADVLAWAVSRAVRRRR
ncbi:MAG: flippase-like domain-containing protein [Polyangiaceae bacterium]|nr:flippase-like domain-containing protein [Polyangiaceae bacterium]